MTKRKNPSSKKSTINPDKEVLTVNHAETATDDLAALLADVGMPATFDDSAAETDDLLSMLGDEEIVESADPIAAESDVEAAVGELDLEEAVSAIAAEPEVEPVTATDESDPELDALLASADPIAAEPEVEEATPVVEASEKPVKEKKGKKAKADKGDKPEKAPSKPRVYYGADKVRRLRDNLGDKLGDFMVLTMDDAALEGDALKAKQDETVAIIEAMGVKVKNRATLLLEFAAGKSSRLNNVIATALTLLATDGTIVTGDKGNLFQTLLAKPYSPAAARAMGNNTVNMLRQLKLIELDGPLTYVANPNSLLLAFVTEKMGLSFGELNEGDAEDEVIEVAPVASTDEATPVEENLEQELEALV